MDAPSNPKSYFRVYWNPLLTLARNSSRDSFFPTTKMQAAAGQSYSIPREDLDAIAPSHTLSNYRNKLNATEYSVNALNSGEPLFKAREFRCCCEQIFYLKL